MGGDVNGSEAAVLARCDAMQVYATPGCECKDHRSTRGQLFIQPIKHTPSTTTSAAPVSGRPWYVSALSCGALTVAVPPLPSAAVLGTPRTSWFRNCWRIRACSGVMAWPSWMSALSSSEMTVGAGETAWPFCPSDFRLRVGDLVLDEPRRDREAVRASSAAFSARFCSTNSARLVRASSRSVSAVSARKR